MNSHFKLQQAMHPQENHRPHESAYWSEFLYEPPTKLAKAEFLVLAELV
jgi:hypothetical protein